MKALLVKSGDELRKVFNELTEQVNSAQPENIPQPKMTLIFKNELFYDIEPSKRIQSWVDTTFVFKENDYGEKEVPISLPQHFFINYSDLNLYNLPIFNRKDLEKIKEYAESEEDYKLCADIRDVIKNHSKINN